MAVDVTYYVESQTPQQIGTVPAGEDVVGLSNGNFVTVGTYFSATRGTIYSNDRVPQWRLDEVAGNNAAVDQLANGNIVVVSQDTDSIRFAILSSVNGDTIVGSTDLGDTDSTNPDVAALSGGRFVIVSNDQTGGVGHIDITLRSAAGAATLVAPIDIAPAAGSSFSAPRVAALDDGNFAVVWTNTIGTQSETWHAVYTPQGVAIKSPSVLADGGTIARAGAVTAINDGYAVAIVTNSTSSNTGTDILVARYNLNGSLKSLVVTNISDPTNANPGMSELTPALTRLSNGLIAVAYDDNSGNNRSIKLTLIDDAGKIVASPSVFPDTHFGGDPSNPQIAAYGDGRFALVYEDSSATAGSNGRVMTIERRSFGNGGSDNFTVADSLRDVMLGGNGDDRMISSGGSNTLDGGAGIDTAAFAFGRANYHIEKTAAAIVVEDVRPGKPDGTNETLSVERFVFAGATTSVETFTPRNFNGDLKSDLAWYNDATGSSVVFLMNGLTSTSGVVVGPANGASWDLMATGDLNGDGQSDMIWQNTSGQVVGYIMNGTSIASAAVIGSPGASFRVVGVGDLNADGNSDIILQDGNGQAVAWLMNGTTIQSAVGIGPANGAAWSIKAVGDLNGDSRADLVWQNTDGSTVGYIMNGGSIVAANQIGGALGANWSVKGIGDLNGDFAADIIWQYSNGQAGVWLMNGTSIAAAQGIGGANGSQFEIRDIADLNGDARMDLVWENMSTGQAVGFLMSGSTILAAANIGGANGEDWKIV